MTRIRIGIQRSGWSLYWIVADGYEDCFVVARNSRSAARVEVDYSGFDPKELAAIRIKPIPASLLRAWRRHRKRARGDELELPGYADEWVLKRLGAQFRVREEIEETLIDSVVYSRGGDESIEPRTIGSRYISDSEAKKEFQWLGRQEAYSHAQIALFTILGICLARCHEIEFLISHSFILGGISKLHQSRNDSVTTVVDTWKKMTMGQMLRSIEETWEIDPVIHAGIRVFGSMRNELAHGLTMAEQYSTDDS